MTSSHHGPETRPGFSASTVTAVVRDLISSTKAKSQDNWLAAVACAVSCKRPDLADEFCVLLGVESFDRDRNPLQGLTIGEIGVCYEALTAMSDSSARRAAGQYFTPDDAARFMAQQSVHFPEGTWMDPCCGVGNLAWHLASVQNNPAEFVRNNLILVDIDDTALRSAIALIGADYLPKHDLEGLRALRSRSERRDFLARTQLPEHDFIIVNPPYARTAARAKYATSASRELFAYFLERISNGSRGFISVTPASYLSAPKFEVLREVIDKQSTGGRVYVFDNVPDTLFRGYKFGSSNTSNTNFVRAAITVCSPSDSFWQITPIIRWRSVSRPLIFPMAGSLLTDRRVGPAGEWAKIPRNLTGLWEMLSECSTKLQDLTVRHLTPFKLTVGMTPRYYISAAYRDLTRGSKATLYFATADDRDRAAVVMNSSVPYFWWRVLDGGVTLPRRVLMSTPIPQVADPDGAALLARELQETEDSAITTKLNAGKLNENVKRSSDIVDRLNRAVLGYSPDFSPIYSQDLTADSQISVAF